jgi:hypothetical protein
MVFSDLFRIFLFLFILKILSGCGGGGNLNQPDAISIQRFLFDNEIYTISADSNGSNLPSKITQAFALKENTIKSIEVFSIGYLNTNLPSKFAIINPQKSNGSLIIYNHGHDGLPVDGQVWAGEFFNLSLNHGYSILLTSMPLVGLNTPRADTEYWINAIGNYGQSAVDYRLLSTWPIYHEIYQAIAGSGNFMHFFVDAAVLPLSFLSEKKPPAAIINSNGLNFPKFDSIHYVGLSGGGFSGLVACAFVQYRSCTLIAGFLPTALKLGALKNWGDSEQWAAGFFSHYSYEDLMRMAAMNSPSTTYIYNSNDDCCFSDPAATEFKLKHPEYDIRVLPRNTHSFDPLYILNIIKTSEGRS